MNDLHLLVAIGEDRYALRIEWVCEVLRATAVTPVPGAPATVRGLVNLRGEVLPALEASALRGAVPRDVSSAMVLLEAGALRAGLMVHDLVDVVPLPLGLEPSENPVLLGSALLDGGLVGVVDVPALLESLTAKAPA